MPLPIAVAAAIPSAIKQLLSLIPNKNARAEAEEAFATAEQAGTLQTIIGQLAINKQEAAHKSMFVAGWRPFIGWTCGVVIAYNWVVYPFLKVLVLVFMDAPPELPVLTLGEMMPVILGMLGLGGFRSWEKHNGVARES